MISNHDWYPSLARSLEKVKHEGVVSDAGSPLFYYYFQMRANASAVREKFCLLLSPAQLLYKTGKL